MSSPKVLIVDDSAVVRRIVQRAIEEDGRIEVAGMASNGRVALERIERLSPDVIILDVEMPELDGVGTLRELRTKGIRLPVIMFSTLTARGAGTTLEALSLGASDYVTKPSGSSLQSAGELVRAELIPKVLALAEKQRARTTVRPTARTATTPVPSPSRTSRGRRPHVLVIGVSTGGPPALEQIIPALPGNLPVPVLIVQHMPPTFTGLLAERLDRLSTLEVCEAGEGDLIRPGKVFIAPGGQHMIPQGSSTEPRIHLTLDPPVHSCRPAVDPMFTAAVGLWGDRVLGLVLTGMGHDGRAGARAIHDAGGTVFVQDEDTSVVWGMPSGPVEDGTADAMLPLGQISDRLIAELIPTGSASPIPSSVAAGRRSTTAVKESVSP